LQHVRKALTLPATSRHDQNITRRYDTAGHSLDSRLCRVPGPTTDLGEAPSTVRES
jgi:hypothetical protein